MFGAIYTGLSGLVAYSQGLQTISNNVANLNTSGFKASDVRFRDQINGSGGGLVFSGNGSSGNGVSVDDFQVNFSQGDLRQSDNGLDLAVEGSGFLLLLDGDRTLYTRTGSFEVDTEGFVVLQGTDYRLAILDDGGRAVGVNIDGQRTSRPSATESIIFADNLSSTSNDETISDLRVFDASGEEHIWDVRFVRDQSSIGNEWSVTVTNAAGRQVGAGVLRFNTGAVDSETAQLVITDSEVEGLEVSLDFSDNVTSFSSGTVSTLRAASIDGNTVGTITNIAVNVDGEIELSYSNEETTVLGPVALADFRNPQALESSGEGFYLETSDAQKQVLASSDPRVGRVLSGRLEASNVDLSDQFGELILIQRGFQASSQIISVSNDMIQQLFGIRGQG